MAAQQQSLCIMAATSNHQKSRRSFLPLNPAPSTPFLHSLETSIKSRPLALFSTLASLLLLLLLHHIILTIPSPSPSAPPHPRSYTRHATTNHDSDQQPAGSEYLHNTGDDHEEEKRVFRPYGSAAALFVVYGAYRGGDNTFAVVGLGSKPLYVYGKPEFECYWVPSSSSSSSSSSSPNGSHTDHQPIKSKIANSMLPDYGYGRVYTVVVVNCTFQEAVGTSPHHRGGQLVLYASHGDGLGKPAERIVALKEDEHSYNASLYGGPPYPYEYVYCGSPLFSNLNAQRIREWMAYHVMLFGPKSHFIFHDAGGMHEEVRAVLEPWRKLGFVTIQNVKQTTEYDGYYYNQFLILNDCLHRTKFLAHWTFFFDVDEYVYIGPDVTLRSVLDWHANDTFLAFKQLRMSNSLCQYEEPENDSRWAFEKLVYGEQFHDMKYAVQARQVYAVGVHSSQKELGHMEGEMGWAWWPHMRFYHYHNTISKHEMLCENITNNSTSFTLNGKAFELDTSMVSLGPLAQDFEHKQIGIHDNITAFAPT